MKTDEPPNLSTVVTFRLTPDQVAQIDRIAVAEDRKRAAVVRRLFLQALNGYAKKGRGK